MTVIGANPRNDLRDAVCTIYQQRLIAAQNLGPTADEGLKMNKMI